MQKYVFEIYACLSLSQQSEQKVTLPPSTVAMCAILADQVLTQRKKPRLMTYFDPLLTPPKQINGLGTTEVQRHPQEDDPKIMFKRTIQTKSLS